MQIAALKNYEQNSTATSGKVIIAVYAAYVCRSLVINARSLQVFRSHKNTTFLTIRTNISTFPTVGENVHSSRTAIRRSLDMEE